MIPGQIFSSSMPNGQKRVQSRQRKENYTGMQCAENYKCFSSTGIESTWGRRESDKVSKVRRVEL